MTVVVLGAGATAYATTRGDGVRTQGESAVVPATLGGGFPLSGQGTAIQISDGGNIVRYESPPGYEHIGVGAFSEGYVLCYTRPGFGETNTFDTGSAASGWGPGSVDAVNHKVVRTTSDGFIRLTQTFTMDAPNHALTIKSDIKNLAGFGLQFLTFRRQVDFDVDTGGAQGYAGFQNYHSSTTSGSVFAWNPPTGVGVPVGQVTHLMILSNVKGGANAALVTSQILDSSCQATSAFSPQDQPFHGDFGDTLRYGLGTLVAGATKTVTVRYQRS